MNIHQMVKHCAMFDEWMPGKNQPVYKQAFIGRLFGKIALKGLLKDEAPMKRNMVAIARNAPLVKGVGSVAENFCPAANSFCLSRKAGSGYAKVFSLLPENFGVRRKK